ncbi:hypothetical protein [Acinetobacter nosocomialis]|uniref:hypothetical protein n=1 Tax=Acinetobacter nosocomialis TaxID=106654 RepID=UPI00124E14B7|nr:hypothetical protein [Acinetobacter nosocomialis]
MEKYKIKINSVAEARECSALMKELGYKEDNTFSRFNSRDNFGIACSDGSFGYGLEGMTDENDQDITLPQLRDLVVLKRNDINDATHTDGDRNAFLDSDGKYHYWCFQKNEWFDAKHISFLVQYLRPIKKNVESATGRFDENGDHHLTFSNGTDAKDPTLISGRDAWLANFDGKDVEFNNKLDDKWHPFNSETWECEELKGDSYLFRLKPQTIKLELEIPAPYKAKIGGRDDTSFVLNVGRHQYCYKTEDDYTKARDALEAVFDSAVRGTNS